MRWNVILFAKPRRRVVADRKTLDFEAALRRHMTCSNLFATAERVMPGFVLLDRDGVINRRIMGGYVTCWEKFVFLPGALDALRLLREKDYHAIVVSNQQGVGKGLMSAADLEEITRKFVAEVEAQGGRIREVYYCTHGAQEDCPCRKPKPGLLRRAQAEHHFAFQHTFLIGDSESDLRAAQAVGCPAIMVSDAPPAGLDRLPHAPRAVVPSLLAAAEFLLSKSGCYNSVTMLENTATGALHDS
jgi:D-glycero-D-manno-heptose 1,7-bisphosphate phosphatase